MNDDDLDTIESSGVKALGLAIWVAALVLATIILLIWIDSARARDPVPDLVLPKDKWVLTLVTRDGKTSRFGFGNERKCRDAIIAASQRMNGDNVTSIRCEPRN